VFKATLDSTKTWKQIVDALATLLTEAQFVATSTGLTLRQMDSSRAAMIDLSLPAAIFQEYNCDKEQQICLGVDELTKVSKRMAGEDKLEFSVVEQRFHIRMIGQADRLFKLQMLTPPESPPKKPSPDFDIRAELYADGFKQAVKDVGVVSSHVKIVADKDTLTFIGEGDTGEAEVSLKVGEEATLFDLKAKNKATSMYALNYLSEISKAMSGDTLILQFSTNKPIMLDFDVAEGSRVSFILAPRVERR